MKSILTIDSLCVEATTFAQNEANASEPTLYGVTDGKAIGTYIVTFLLERRLPVDDIQAYQIAEEILTNPPQIGYLTISNALQWRLQYRRAIQEAGNVDGLRKVL